MNSQTKIIKTVNFLNKVSYSRYFLISLIFIFTIIGILQIVYTANGIYNITNNTNSIAYINPVANWVAVIFSSISSVFSVIGTFFLITLRTKFFAIFQLMNLFFYIPSMILIGLFYTAILNFILIFSPVVFLFKKETHNNKKLKSLGIIKTILIYAIFSGLGGLLGYLITLPQNPLWRDTAPYFDGVNMMGSLAGWTLITMRFVEAPFVFIANSITFTLEFVITTNAYSQMFLFIFFILLDSLMSINWYIEFKSQGDKLKLY